MNNISDIKKFIGLKTLAVAGVSGKGNEFSNIIVKDLRKKGYIIYSINPNVSELKGEKFFKNISSLTQKPDGVLIMTNRNVTLDVIKDAYDSGITNIWMQQKSESEEALEFCKQNGINFVSGECILMFTEPVKSVHKFHRWINKIFKKYPS